MKVIAVHAFAKSCDKVPEAIFTVAAKDNTDALALVRADNAGVFYDRFSTETYAEVSAYPEAGIIASSPCDAKENFNRAQPPRNE